MSLVLHARSLGRIENERMRVGGGGLAGKTGKVLRCLLHLLYKAVDKYRFDIVLVTIVLRDTQATGLLLSCWCGLQVCWDEPTFSAAQIARFQVPTVGAESDGLDRPRAGRRRKRCGERKGLFANLDLSSSDEEDRTGAPNDAQDATDNSPTPQATESKKSCESLLALEGIPSADLLSWLWKEITPNQVVFRTTEQSSIVIVEFV